MTIRDEDIVVEDEISLSVADEEKALTLQQKKQRINKLKDLFHAEGLDADEEFMKEMNEVFDELLKND